MLKIFWKTGLRWLWVTAVVFVLDRVTKTIVLQKLRPFIPYRLTDHINFTLAFNKGVAFSFFNNASGGGR